MIGVVQQVKKACQRKNRLATVIGFLIGGFVPFAIYFTAHKAGFAWANAAHSSAPTLVFGGLIYSAQTIYQWAKMAFDNALKSVGFCVLLEGVMVTSQIHWLAIVALCYLVAINGIATGCVLSLGRAGK